MKKNSWLYGSIIALLCLGVLLGAWDAQGAAAQEVGWTPATPLPIPMAGHLVQCPDDPGSFYMVGGIKNVDISSNRLFRYDIGVARWTRLANIPRTIRAVALTCYQGKIYSAGGISYMRVVNTLYIYDIASDSWSKGMNLPDKVWGAALGAWQGELYLVGGSRFGGSPYTPESRVDVYSIASGQWAAGGGAAMPVAASFFASTQVGSYLYAVGGFSGDLNQNVDPTQLYDMSTNTWELGPAFTSARAMGGLAATSNHLYMLGGDLDGGTAFDVTNLVDVLDLSNWPDGAWAEGPALPAVNLYPATTCTEVLAGGEIWDVGGLDVTPVWVVTDAVYYLPIGEGCP